MFLVGPIPRRGRVVPLRATGNTVTVIRASYFQENILGALPAAEHDGLYPMTTVDEILPALLAARTLS